MKEKVVNSLLAKKFVKIFSLCLNENTVKNKRTTGCVSCEMNDPYRPVEGKTQNLEPRLDADKPVEGKTPNLEPRLDADRSWLLDHEILGGRRPAKPASLLGKISEVKAATLATDSGSVVRSQTLLPYMNVQGVWVHTGDGARAKKVKEPTFAVLDTASTCSYVSERFLQTIPHIVLQSDLKLTVKTLGNHTQVHDNQKIVKFTLRTSHGDAKIVACTVPHITQMPKSCTHAQGAIRKAASGFSLNHCLEAAGTKTDLLIGQPSVLAFMGGSVAAAAEQPALRLLETTLGWVPTGDLKVGCTCANGQLESYTTSCQKLAETIEQLWKLEQMTNDNEPCLSQDELSAYKHFEANVTFDEKRKRYCVGLPWRTNDGCPPSMPSTYNVAFARNRSFEAKFKDYDEKTRARILESVEQHIEKGRYVEVPEHLQAKYRDPAQTGVYFMPPRVAWNAKSSTTSCRFCFDCSQKARDGKSLNCHMYRGPRTTPDLDRLLLRFRKSKYTVSCDLKQMFLCVDLKERDQPYQTFLWRPGGPLSGKKLTMYTSKVVLFGNRASPFLASYVLKEHARRTLGKTKDPEEIQAANSILKDIYADDLTASIDTEEEALSLVKGLEKLFPSAGFLATKYKSSSKKVLAYLRKLDPTKIADSHKMLINCGNPFEGELSVPAYCPGQDKKDADAMSGADRILGQSYDAHTDELLFDNYGHVEEKIKSTKVPSQRSLAAAMASVSYDLTGRIAPFVLKARVLLQRIFRRNAENKVPNNKATWDRPLDLDIKTDFNQWAEQLSELKRIKMPRALNLQPDHELIGFGDASNVGLGAVIYARDRDPETGKVRVQFIAGKSKVRPLKMDADSETEQHVTIPRTELMSSALVHKLAERCRDSLGTKKSNITLYTDSSCVYWWYRTAPGNLIPWVHNRILPIIASEYPVLFCPSEQNPADIAAKSADASQIVTGMWDKGPSFIRLPKAKRPVFDPLKVTSQDRGFCHGIRREKLVESLATFLTLGLPDELRAECLAASVKRQTRLAESQKEFDESVMDRIAASTNDDFFTFNRRVAAWLLIKDNRQALLQKSRRRLRSAARLVPKGLAHYMPKAKLLILAYWQRKHFRSEWERLRAGEQVEAKSRLAGLNPYLDTIQNVTLIRSRSRLGQADGSALFREPIILPKVTEDKSDVVRQLISYEHRRRMHNSASALHFLLRQNYWILQGKEECRKMVKFCIKCNRINASRMSKGQMAELPRDRVSLDRSGILKSWSIDSAGPFELRTSCPEQEDPSKCGLRSCHLLVIIDNLSRYIIYVPVPTLSAKDVCAGLLCAFGIYGIPTSILSDGHATLKRLNKDLTRTLRSQELQDFAVSKGFKWTHTFAYAAHLNSSAEAAVKLAKQALYKSLGRRKFNYADFTATVTYMMFSINNRPIYPMPGKDPEEMGLTPSMLVFGRSLDEFDILGMDNEVQTDYKQIWADRIKARDVYESAFKAGYLDFLAQRPFWKQKPKSLPQPGQVYLFSGAGGRSAKVVKPTRTWLLARVLKRLPNKINGSIGYLVRLSDGVYQKTKPDGVDKKVKAKAIKKPTEIETSIHSLVKLEGLSKIGDANPITTSLEPSKSRKSKTDEDSDESLYAAANAYAEQSNFATQLLGSSRLRALMTSHWGNHFF